MGKKDKKCYDIDRQEVQDFILLKEFNQIYLTEHAHRCVALNEGKKVSELVSKKDERFLDWNNRTEIIRKAKRSSSYDSSFISRTRTPPSIHSVRRSKSLADIRR